MRMKTIALLFFATIGLAGTAWACRTPVYRYAIMNWPANPYYVFYFHHGKVEEADEALHAKIKDLASRREGPIANLSLVPVDATKPEALDNMPNEVVEAWRKIDDGQTPQHLLYTAWGAPLHAGRIDEAFLASLADSPARKKLGELLQAGNGIVWLVLEGKDKKANAEAKKAVEAIVADCRSGKLSSPPDEPMYGLPGPGEADEPTTFKPKPSDMIRTAMLSVSPDDKAETWFVRSLLAIRPLYGPTERDTESTPPGEDSASSASSEGRKAGEGREAGASTPAEKESKESNDKPEQPADKEADEEKAKQQAVDISDGPRVYAVYGRGRAMPPYTGKNITVDDLADCLLFLAGPCSCMLKDDNPGFDLLMNWDWDATATAVAEIESEMLIADEEARERAAETPAAKPATPVEPAAASPGATAPAHTPEAAEAKNIAPTSEGAADPAATAAAVTPETEASFARRQSSQFVMILLAVGGIVFVGGTALWLLLRGR